MKTTNLSATGSRQTDAFSFIEITAALSVMAILTAIILYSVRLAETDSRIAQTFSSYEAVRAATALHMARYRLLTQAFYTNASPAQLQNWDTGVLLPEQYLEHVFQVSIGNGALVQVVQGPGNNGNGYSLNGVNNRTINNNWTAECVISNVTPLDAHALAFCLEPKLVNPNDNAPDAITNGVAEWSCPCVVNGVTIGTNMCLYLTGQ
jgi:type II secretory pathway pseudopilin PulG